MSAAASDLAADGSAPADESAPGGAAPSLADKLRFLQSGGAFAGPADMTPAIETHMSWVFFTRDRVYKLKKPVRFPFLDFTTLAARNFFCHEEVRLNARLAPDVYLGLVALQSRADGMALVPEEDRPDAGQTVDWLVVMRRLPQERMLSRLMADHAAAPREIDALVAVLTRFYAQAPKSGMSAREYATRFQREQAINREVLLRPQFTLRGAGHALAELDARLAQSASLLDERARRGCVVDGHGDLRPEHICMLTRPVVIDCLEFNATLRQVDPLSELAFLALECDMAGAPWIGAQLEAGCAGMWHQTPPMDLMHLYSAHHALLRARIAMAHLLDPEPRLPEKWPPIAQRYIDRALRTMRQVDTAAS